MNWTTISQESNLSFTFLKEHQEELDWVEISSHVTLDEEFLSTFRGKIKWKHIILNPSFSPSLVEYVSDYKEVPWKIFSWYYPLTIDLCKKIEKKIHALYLRINKQAKILVVTHIQGQKVAFEFRESETTTPQHYNLVTKKDGKTYKDYSKEDPLVRDRITPSLRAERKLWREF